jgi:alginate O-acetyltransferase complex protein AlgI
MAFLAIAFLEIVQFFQERTSLNALVSRQPALVRWGIYYALIMVIILFGVFEEAEFIYFQF